MPTSLGATATAPPIIGIDENALRYIVGPLIVVAANLIYKTISEIRTDHLAQVRLIKAMIHEVDVARKSWHPYAAEFAAAYAGGGPHGAFACKIAEDPRYFAYSVSNRSTTSVFAAEAIPIKTYGFLRSEVMEKLVDFHDSTALLTNSLADMRENTFRDLPAARKLAAIGNVVSLFEDAEGAYRPCRDALLWQEALLTTRSLTWVVLFPIRSGSYPFAAVIGWILLNMAWRAMAGG